MKNALIGLAAILGLVSVAPQAQAGEWFAVIENDATFVNKGVDDFGLTAAGVGYSTFIADDAVLTAELSTGGIYGSGEFNHIIKGELGLVTLLDAKGDVVLDVSVENIYDTADGYNVTEIESKVTFGL